MRSRVRPRVYSTARTGVLLQVTTKPVAQGPKLCAALCSPPRVVDTAIRRRAFCSYPSSGRATATARRRGSGPARGGAEGRRPRPLRLLRGRSKRGDEPLRSSPWPRPPPAPLRGPRAGPGLDALREELEALLDRYAATAVVHPYRGERGAARALRCRTPILFLVRPDGHVAYRGEAADVVGLEAYLERLFVRRGTTERPPASPRRKRTAA
jgi:hypothetical protein